MHHPVANGFHLAQVLQRAAARGDKFLQYRVQRAPMVGHALFFADAADITTRQHLAGGRVPQFVLDRRTPRVEDEDLHACATTPFVSAFVASGDWSATLIVPEGHLNHKL